jgi:hypothetical protein
MEAAALYACRSVLCLAQVTNQMGRIEGDFEKGAAGGAEESHHLQHGIELVKGHYAKSPNAVIVSAT